MTAIADAQGMRTLDSLRGLYAGRHCDITNPAGVRTARHQRLRCRPGDDLLSRCSAVVIVGA